MQAIIPRSAIRIETATLDDLPAIDALQKQFGKALGYFPTAELFPIGGYEMDTASRYYAHAKLLWCIVPLMLFWQCRLWLSTTRGYMHDDPIVYAARDWVSWLVMAALGALVAGASLLPVIV